MGNFNLLLIALFAFTASGLHHSKHGSFKGRFSPAVENIRTSISDKINQLKATSDRIAKDRHALVLNTISHMTTDDTTAAASSTETTSTTTPETTTTETTTTESTTTAAPKDQDTRSWWDKFLDWLFGR